MTDKPVAGYYRVSKARDGMTSPTLYEDEIERYCTYKRLTLAKTYSDLDYSGFRNSRERPALKELIDDRHDYSQVIVPKLSRFGRSVKHLMELFDLFDRDAIPLVFLDMNVDTSTSQGRLLRNVMAAFAEYESDVKADYSRASNRLAALKGKAPYSAAFGYIRIDGEQLVDAEKAPWVARMFERRAEGWPIWDVSAWLNSQGAQTTTGVPWSEAVVRRMLGNPVYIGVRVVDGERVPGSWEPLIDNELWDRVQAMVGRRRRKVGMRPGGHFLSKLMVCGNCGALLGHYHNKERNERARYVCRAAPGRKRCPGIGSVARDDAEAFVYEQVSERFPVVERRSPTGEVTERMSFDTAWPAATIAQRNELLRIVLHRVVLLPRADSHDRREPRRMRIEWRDDLLETDRTRPLPVELFPVSESPTIECSLCGRDLPMERYSPSQRGYRNALCRECLRRSRRLRATTAVMATALVPPVPQPPHSATAKVAAASWREVRDRLAEAGHEAARSSSRRPLWSGPGAPIHEEEPI